MALVTKASFNGGELSPSVSFRSDQPKYHTGVEIMRNALPLIQGPVIRRPGLKFMSQTKYPKAQTRVIPFVFNRDQAYQLEFGHLYIAVRYNGRAIIDPNTGDPLEFIAPYDKSEIFDIHYSQSADVLFLAHPNHPVMRVERRDNDDWRIVEMVFGSNQLPPTTITANITGASERTYGYVVTAVNDDTGEESVASSRVTVVAGDDLNTANTITLTWDAVAGATLYNIYKDREESMIYGYIGSASPDNNYCKFVDRGMVPSADDHPPEARNPFNGPGNYPSCVTMFEQRLCFAGLLNKPQTVFMSQTANFNNFNVSSPPKDDDAVTFTLASGLVNRILWMYGTRKLQIGTIGGEWTVSGVDGGPITPISVDARNIGSLGSVNLRPIYINGMTMFVQADGHTVRELRYDYVSDAFIPRNQILFADHLFEGKRIVDWAYQSSPYSVIWCVLDDGTMAGYTYNLEQEVYGWHRHDTDGLIESVCVTPWETWDDVYVVVKRGDVKTVERIRPYSLDRDINDHYLVDSGATIISADDPWTEVPDLEHLAGKEVSLLLDGYVYPPVLVPPNGIVPLPEPAMKISIGLPYTTDVVPLPYETVPGTNVPSTLLLDRNINSAKAYFYRTSGGEWGIAERLTNGKIDLRDDLHLYELLDRSGSELNQPLPLESAVKELIIPGNNGPRETIIFRQNGPLPFNLFALTINVECGRV